MNRDEALTELAMGLPEWPVSQTEWGAYKFRYDMLDKLVVPLDRAWDEVLTERDWLQRRAELINKPPWSDAPEWAQWLAQSPGGHWEAFELKPKPMARYWSKAHHALSGRSAKISNSCGAIPTGHDWRQTLEARPAFDEERMDRIGANGPTGDHYMTQEEEEIPAQEKIDCERCGGCYYSPPHDACPCGSGRSDGSTASYYELPEGATELQDLISYRNLNSQDGEIFRAIYRKGRASHSDELRDAKKVLFYAKAEVERLERYGR